ncbi:MAG: hypothetical protein AB1646_03400 [Thermodesulfobacteriota bacterium]
MYAWLDNRRAHACGENLAFVRYEFEKNLFDELKADISTHVELAPKDSSYVVFKDEAGNQLGKFVVGKRIRAPLTGHGAPEGEDSVDAA